jgi:hypothetical protein
MSYIEPMKAVKYGKKQLIFYQKLNHCLQCNFIKDYAKLQPLMPMTSPINTNFLMKEAMVANHWIELPDFVKWV